MPVLDPEESAVGGAEDHVLLAGEELVRHPVEGASGVGASVLVGPQRGAGAHDEDRVQVVAVPEVEAPGPRIGNLGETAENAAIHGEGPLGRAALRRPRAQP